MRSAVTLLALTLAACTPKPLGRIEVERYTALKLCPAVQVNDLTTPEARNGVIGFSWHVRLHMDARCSRDLQEQLAELSSGSCKVDAASCWIILPSRLPRPAGNATLIVDRRGGSEWELRVFK